MNNPILCSVGMKGFKCFDALTVDLGLLTVLSGYNGAGKSTVLQSILLYSQALRKINSTGEDSIIPEGRISIWPLNGDLVRLGTCGEITRPSSNIIQFKYKFKINEQFYTSNFEFIAEQGERNLKERDFQEISTNPQSIAEAQFISAVRGTIADVTPIPDDPNYYIEGVGTDGKYTGYWFDKFSGEIVDKSLTFDQSEGQTLDTQVNAWLNYLFPGTSAIVNKFEKASVIAPQFQLSEFGEWRSPANIGFGISYVFPIIVALLSAKKGDLIIIDSPEAHLHPQAQSRVGKMIAKFAEAGVQVILETHSDHILNGVRLAVKQGDLNAQNLSLLFFSGVSESGHGVISTEIDKNGNIEHWPPGFFDQMDSDIVELLSNE